MTRKRVYEIARQQHIPSHELLARLTAAGIEGKAASSSVEEDEALAALTNGGGDRVRSNGPPPAPVRRNGSEPQRRSGPPAPAPGWTERAGLRLRLWSLGRRRRRRLEDLGGLVVELRRAGSRRQDVLDGQLESAADLEAEQRELEVRLGIDTGGTCPHCGLHARRTRYCLSCGHPLQPAGVGSKIVTMSPPALVVAVLLITAAWLFGGVRFGGDHRHSTRAASVHARTPVNPYRNLVASVKGRRIGIYRSQGDARPYRTLSNPNLDGAPLVFLVKHDAGRWLQVYLPSRPNGSTGWIRASDAGLSGHDYRMRIDLRQHTLTAWSGARRVLNTPVGVGRAVTPTPSGLYYITELLKQPDPNGLYGPYAFGLSAHSNVLHEFAGADGILGIHGTDFPAGIGTDVSHGCIRVSNAAITRLARMLPAGTPVRITRA